MSKLRVGLERAPITPPIGIQQIGFWARDHGSENILDDLYATAVVFADAAVKLALVSCDLLFLHPTMVARIRAEVAARTDIPPERVMLCCTHTHSAPITYATEQQGDMERAYLNTLAHAIAGAVCAASSQLQPARLSLGRATLHIGANRRLQRANGRVVIDDNPAGPVDPEMLVVRLDAEDGGPLLALANYACHAVALGSESYGLSADWPGAMRAEVEAATGATCAFIQGAGADINPRGGPARDYGRAQRLGQEAAGAVIQAWAGATEMEDATLGAAQRLLAFPLQGPATTSERPVDRVAKETYGVLFDEFLPRLDQRFPWAAQVQVRDGQWSVAGEMQAFRVGRLGIVAAPVEPFVEVGLAVKRRSPLGATFFAGYSNGCLGYLPTPPAYEIGGYEVDTSFFYYHLPAPLAPECADLVEAAAIDMLGELAG